MLEYGTIVFVLDQVSTHVVSMSLVWLARGLYKPFSVLVLRLEDCDSGPDTAEAIQSES